MSLVCNSVLGQLVVRAFSWWVLDEWWQHLVVRSPLLACGAFAAYMKVPYQWKGTSHMDACVIYSRLAVNMLVDVLEGTSMLVDVPSRKSHVFLHCGSQQAQRFQATCKTPFA